MNIYIATEVEQDYKTVFSKFDVKLFKQLKPPLVGLKVHRFDGCAKDDRIYVEINVMGIKQRWDALISANDENDKGIFFIDEGLRLPFFLKSWMHVHRIINNNNSSLIIDDINYKTQNIIFDFILYPLIYYQFYFRKHIYKSYFKNNCSFERLEINKIKNCFSDVL